MLFMLCFFMTTHTSNFLNSCLLQRMTKEEAAANLVLEGAETDATMAFERSERKRLLRAEMTSIGHGSSDLGPNFGLGGGAMHPGESRQAAVVAVWDDEQRHDHTKAGAEEEEAAERNRQVAESAEGTGGLSHFIHHGSK